MKMNGLALEEKSSFTMLGVFLSKLELVSYNASIAKIAFKKIGAFVYRYSFYEISFT